MGSEVFDSYGRKCNSRYLLNYGFVVPDNPETQIVVIILISAFG
jgi:histone-lysine N-methyltransferase SETD3